ncbi:DUF4328 domain-containing protein [Streptomyces sp. NPDC003077]|uniref:DUF4328 domain-containing protein n=1 Tax=Streptomyces sp. NPDC003077 TaxID=3154443 RepID=UPI0033B91BB8
MSYHHAGLPPAGPVLRSPDGLANAITLLLVVMIVIDLFSIGAGANMRALMDDPLSASMAELNRADAMYMRVGIFQILGTLATAVVFIIWLHRVRTNAEIFAADMCSLGRGWAIGAWFVPIANLWLPYRVARESWDASTQMGPDGMWRNAPKGVLNAWWTLWVVGGILSRIGGFVYQGVETPEELKKAAGLLMFCDVLGLAAAVLAILFVRKLTSMQEIKIMLGPVASV